MPKFPGKVPPRASELTLAFRSRILREQWIRAKYDREEFIYPDKQMYTSGKFECYLMKRGKENEKFQSRKFVLDESKDTLVYYVKEHKDPKTVIRISELNATFADKKLGHPNSLQLSYVNAGSTRHIFVYAKDGKVLMTFRAWYSRDTSCASPKCCISAQYLESFEFNSQGQLV